MLQREVGPYKKPQGMLLAVPIKRRTPKSRFLRRIERTVRDNAAFEQQVREAQRQLRDWPDMPLDYTCGCGLYVHPENQHNIDSPDAIHIAGCAWA